MGRVVDVNIGNHRISGLVLGSKAFKLEDNGTTLVYTPSIADTGEFFCDCQGFQGNETICSHILALLRQAETLDLNIERFIKALRGEVIMREEDYIETSLEGWNKLFGGLRKDKISGLNSEPDVGKSFLNTQFAIDILRIGKNALIIDTEGGIEEDWLHNIAERFSIPLEIEYIEFPIEYESEGKKDTTITKPVFKYQNLKYKIKTKNTVYIWDHRNVLGILTFHGRPMLFREKSGVKEPIDMSASMTSVGASPIGIICDKCNIGYISYDSISAPIEKEFTGGQQNYPRRTKVTQAWLGRAQELLDLHELVVMNIIHASIAHNNPYADPIPVGGKGVLHNTKYVAFLEKYKNKKLRDWRSNRKLNVFRHMMKAPWSENALVKIKGDGFHDLVLN